MKHRIATWVGRGAAALCCAGALSGWALAQALPGTPWPRFAELEAAGARIGEIRVVAREIFDLEDPLENKLLFRWANALHIHTRPGVIERALLFKSGEPLVLRRLEETERVLRSSRYLYDVQFRVLAVRDGVVDIEVSTRDTWSLEPGANVGRQGGANSSGVHLTEHNLLGTGISLSVGRSKNVDRSSTEFKFSTERILGTWVALSLSHANNSDGKRNAFTLEQPFYSLESRWAAGLSAVDDERVDALYRSGTVAAEYRHRVQQREAYVGWSPGLVNGWVQRATVGLGQQDDAYALEPGLVAPTRLPADEKRVYPFVRYALIEDRYDRELNRNLIGRPEFFALGLAASVQLGRATTGLGSSLDAWLYAASISRGFEPQREHTLITSASLTGQLTGDGTRRQRLSTRAQHYWRQSPSWLFYASASADLLRNADLADWLLLGGDNGLRGYPLRYQSGTRRALFTAEERFYTDIYWWRLFRIGGAGFVDVGRAWGGESASPAPVPGSTSSTSSTSSIVSTGWLGNVGAGLRIVSARSAFSNVLHVDIAVPLHAPADIKKVQFLVKTRASF
jgi:hypothetical protein